MSSLLAELKRRNVFRVGVAYVVSAWVIIQVVDVVAPAMAMPEWVPGFVILMIVIGFPFAVIFAWAYEITPEGLKKTTEVAPQQSVTRDTGRKIDRIIIGTLALAVGLLLVDRVTGGRGGSGGGAGDVAEASIAVLPFVNLSSDPEQEFFSDGISEELLNLLAQIPELRVAARTSSFQFKGDNQDITRIGQQLNVRHVLEGSVRRNGPEVRITAQLIDAANGYHLWSDTYDREIADVFAVQDEISASIVSALRDELGLEVEVTTPARANETTETDAHEAYLRGRHLVVQRTKATIEGAIAEFERAIEIDPDYALAHAELAMAFGLLDDTQYGDLTAAEVRQRQRPSADRALALAPELPEAQAAVAYADWNAFEYERAIEGFDRALELNPNYAIVYTWKANILDDDLGRYAEAFAVRDVAIDLDPLSIPTIANRARALHYQARFEEAEPELAKLASIAPAFYRQLLAEADRFAGDRAASALGNLEALGSDPDFVRAQLFLSIDLAGMGYDAAIQTNPSSATQPIIHFLLGRFEQGADLATALIREDPDLTWMLAVQGNMLAALGAYQRARPPLEEGWRISNGNVSERGMFPHVAAVALYFVLQRDGDQERAAEVLAAMEDHAQRYVDAGVETAQAYLNRGTTAWLAGDEARAVELLTRAAELGGVPRVPPAYLAEAYADPAFAPVLAASDSWRADQRERFEAVVCENNPSRGAWEPPPEMCGG